MVFPKSKMQSCTSRYVFMYNRLLVFSLLFFVLPASLPENFLRVGSGWFGYWFWVVLIVSANLTRTLKTDLGVDLCKLVGSRTSLLMEPNYLVSRYVCMCICLCILQELRVRSHLLGDEQVDRLSCSSTSKFSQVDSDRIIFVDEASTIFSPVWFRRRPKSLISCRVFYRTLVRVASDQWGLARQHNSIFSCNQHSGYVSSGLARGLSPPESRAWACRCGRSRGW